VTRAKRAKRGISQREARRLKKRIAELEQIEMNRRNSWSADYPGGTHFWTLTVADDSKAAIGTARKLGHAIVATLDGAQLRLYALNERTNG
jgi:hypothetical protein